MAEEDSKNLFAVIFREKLKNRAIKNMLNNEGGFLIKNYFATKYSIRIIII